MLTFVKSRFLMIFIYDTNTTIIRPNAGRKEVYNTKEIGT